MKTVLSIICGTLLILFGCGDNTIVSSRDFLVSITNTSELVIDSIVINRTTQGSTNTFTLENEIDYIQADSLIQISFDISANKNSPVYVSYICYSNDFPIVKKTRSFFINEDTAEVTENKNTTAIEILKKYQSRISGDTTLSILQEKNILDSIFIDLTLTSDDSTAKMIFETYMEKNGTDTAQFVTLLKDTLLQQHTADPKPIIEQMLGITTTDLDRHLLAYIDTNRTYTLPRFTFEGYLLDTNNNAHTITITLTGDNISEPVEKEVSYNPEIVKYSGFIELENIGTNYSIQVSVFDSTGFKTGVKNHTFTTLSFNIEIAPFDATNLIPEIILSVAKDTVNKNDSLDFYWTGSIDSSNTITEYFFKPLNDIAWTSMALTTTRVIQNPSHKGEFQYILKAIDQIGNTVYDTVSITVQNNIPSVINQEFSINENLIKIIGNMEVSDLDNEQLYFTITNGDTSLFKVGHSNGSIEAIKELDFDIMGLHQLKINVSDGDDSVEVICTIHVNNLNDNNPQFEAGDTLTITLVEDKKSTFTIPASDPDGSTLTWNIVNQPILSTVSIDQATGRALFSPKENTFGSDTMQIAVTDGLLTDTLVIVIDITPVDDPTEYTGSPTISGVLNETEVLTAIPGISCTDVDFTNPQFNYQWYKDTDNSGANGEILLNATDSIYTLTQKDGGFYIYVEVNCQGGTPLLKQAYSSKKVYFKNVKEENTLVDHRDSLTYDIVYIGSQIWMAENLNYSGDNDADTVGYCYDMPDFTDSQTCNLYGRLYDWATAMEGASSSNTNPSAIQGICPQGWHLPSDTEWMELSNYIELQNGSSSIGLLLKADSIWTDNSNPGSDNFHFSALPGGYRDILGNYTFVHQAGNWWSTHEESENNAWLRNIYYETNFFNRINATKTSGYSVRCIKDSL